MTTQLVGSMTIAAAIPALGTLEFGWMADLQAELTAQITVCASLQAQVNLSLGDLSAMLSLALSLQVGFNVSLVLPVLSAALALNLAISLTIKAAIELKIKLLLGWADIFATAGLRVYTHDGLLSQVGVSLNNCLNSGGTGGMSLPSQCYGITFLTDSGITYGAMSKVFCV